MPLVDKNYNIIESTPLNPMVFNPESFVNGVFNDEYILVIGNAVILDPEKYSNCKGDINKFILDNINIDLQKKITNFNPYKDFNELFSDVTINGQSVISNFLDNRINYTISDLSPKLRNLLETRLFKFVLTTTIDGYVETLMRSIWPDLRIVNIADEKSLLIFIQELTACRNRNYTHPTLFYVFGKIINNQENKQDFAGNDADYIRFIEKWMFIDKEKIVPFLRAKRILAIGCKYDDWYFRFFWYILTRRFQGESRSQYITYRNENLTMDNLAINFEPKDSHDIQLREYLHRRKVCIHEKVSDFMDKIYVLLTSTGQDNLLRSIVENKRKKGQIFISYKHDNKIVADELFFKLNEKFNVWYDDHSIKKGYNSDIIIKEAIRESVVFLPLLSPHVKKDLESYENHKDENYIKEWRWASEYKYLSIIPIEIGGYHYYDNKRIHLIFEKLIKREKYTTIDLTPSLTNPMTDQQEFAYSSLLKGFDQLVICINEHLGIS